ncbi:MAG TPA: helix-turn-helix domain-containing protein, partial [Candidatus Saccharimonadales bacterium]|nr:helix-turn-helix domain-containing protein [Candidatus Saccharimonadales bacterium]
ANDRPSTVADQDRPMLPVDLPKLIRDTETSYIDAALEKSGGSTTEAAKLLNVKRSTLAQRLSVCNDGRNWRGYKDVPKAPEP